MTNLVYRDTKGLDLTPADADGNMRELERRTGRGWNDLVQDVTVRSGTNAPELMQFRDGIVAYAFLHGTQNECFSNFHFEHDYIAGTMIYPHVHFTVNTTSTGVIRWGIEYTLARRWESVGLRQFGPTNTIYIEQDINPSKQYWHIVSESNDMYGIDGSDLESDALILCRFFRDGGHPNDTFPDAAFLLTVDIHYECDHARTPARFPPFPT